MRHIPFRPCLVALLASAAATPLLAQDSVVLPTITLVGGYEDSRGPFEGYLAGVTATATKSGTPLAEVPQSVSVIGRAEIDARSATRLSEVLRYAPGVTVEADGVDSRFDSISVRGFNTDNATWLDGMLYRSGGGAGNNWTIPQIDSFTLERVEVLKGPSSSVYGQLPPGGMVNQITKQPQSQAAGTDELTLDGFGKATVAINRTGPLSDHIDYRLIVKAGGTGARVSEGDRSRLLFAPSLAMDAAGGRLTVYAQIQRDRGGIEYSWLPARGTLWKNPLGQVSRDYFAGEPGLNSYDRDQYLLGWQYDRELADDLTLRHGLRWSRVKSAIGMVQSDMWDDPAKGWDGRTVDRYALRATGRMDSLVTDTSLNWTVQSGTLTHTVVGGADLAMGRFTGARDSATASALDLFDPVYGGAIGGFEPLSRIKTKTRQLGLYLQDQIEVGNWHLLAGVRHDRASSEIDSVTRRGPRHENQKDSATSARLGALYRFENGFSPYLSWGTSFQPVVGATHDGEAFKPSRGKQIEVGFRHAPSDDLLWTAALFDIRQTNRLTDDPVHGYPDQVQTGEVRIRGFETEVKADLQNGWSLTGALTLLDHKVTKSEIGEELGRPMLFTPDVQASLWADYTVGGGDLDGWVFGAGLRHTGKSRGGDLGTPGGYASMKIPAYTLIDARISAPLDRWSPGLRANLSVNNLADKKYIAGCGSVWTCGYGYGRTATLSLSRNF